MDILIFLLADRYPQIMLFQETEHPITKIKTPEMYFEANILKSLELYWPNTITGHRAEFPEMLKTAMRCCETYVGVKPVIKKRIIPHDENTWMRFYHSSVVKMLDEMSGGFIEVRDEIERMETLLREKGTDELISSKKMALIETPEEARDLWDFYVSQIAPVGECII